MKMWLRAGVLVEVLGSVVLAAFSVGCSGASPPAHPATGGAGTGGGGGGGAGGAGTDTGGIGSGGIGSGGSETGGSGAGGARVPVVLVPFQQARTAFAIAADSANVYWTGDPPGSTVNTAAVMKVSKAGGTPMVVYNAGNGATGALIVDDTSVYFVASIVVGSDVVLKAPKDGSASPGGALVLAQSGAPTGIRDIAIDSNRLYFVNGAGLASVPLGGGPQVTVVDPTGQSPVDPVSGQPIGFPTPSGITTDGMNVYYAAGGWLLSVPVGGGTPTILVSGQVDAANDEPPLHVYEHPVVAGGFIYWQNGTSGIVYRESIQGGSPTILATGLGSSAEMNAMTDGSNLYYLGSSNLLAGSGGLMKVPILGGSPVELVRDRGAYNFGGGQTFPIAVDDTSVYLIAYSGQGIVKVAK